MSLGFLLIITNPRERQREIADRDRLFQLENPMKALVDEQSAGASEFFPHKNAYPD